MHTGDLCYRCCLPCWLIPSLLNLQCCSAHQSLGWRVFPKDIQMLCQYFYLRSRVTHICSLCDQEHFESQLHICQVWLQVRLCNSKYDHWSHCICSSWFRCLIRTYIHYITFYLLREHWDEHSQMLGQVGEVSFHSNVADSISWLIKPPCLNL